MIVNLERVSTFEQEPDIIKSIEVLSSEGRDEVSFAIYTNVEADYNDVKTEFERGYLDFVRAQLVLNRIIAPHDNLDGISISSMKQNSNEGDFKIIVTYCKNKNKETSPSNEYGKVESVQKVFEDETEVEFGVMVAGGKMSPEQSKEILSHSEIIRTLQSRGWVDEHGTPCVVFKVDVSSRLINDSDYAYSIRYYREDTDIKPKVEPLNIEYPYMMEDTTYGLCLSREDAQTLEFSFEVDAHVLSQDELEYELQNPMIVSQLVRKGWMNADTHEKIFPFTHSVHIENPDELPPFKYKVTFTSSVAEN